MNPSVEIAPTRNEVAAWLVSNDPDPCDPVEYDATRYYREFADRLLGSGWQIIPPGPVQS